MADPLRAFLYQHSSFSKNELPEDLLDCVSESELACLVNDAVCQVRGEAASASRTPVWEILLGILAYYYAKGLYLSNEIETRLDENPRISQVYTLAFSYARPAAVLRRFRRTNRRAIELCLAKVLQSAHVRFGREPIDPVRNGGVQLEPSAFLVKARERVQHAVECDSWAMDM